MHYSNLVLIPANGKDIDGKKQSVDKLVEAAMGPHEEDGGFWDWYQIGGRWTGALDGYDPGGDPDNQYKCDLCNGTGKRNDEIGKKHRETDPSYGCNGCNGTGTAIQWPTGFKRHPGDIMPVSKLTEEQLKRFYRVITPWGKFENERFEPWRKKDKFRSLDMPTVEWMKEEFKDYVCVVVDNHS